jgi:hypothetical protein
MIVKNSEEATTQLRAQRTLGSAFVCVFIEPVSSEGAALNAAKDEAGSLMLQAVSSNDTNAKTPVLQSIFESTGDALKQR